ncbi:SAM-dependent methyltransferase [Bordetella bronchialis]|uniref:RNA methyltransferase n=1 Tax=Bordetella bronchialis TaxID=463025 RepID=A0A193FRR4_9BORD|nr:methyltransferase domain-containing protein [Bordetella bronchialis]ANN65303.1 RNA methyltransferase [Bordetella bronchialis]ANN70335.1 RNA methyltransferase [Bordetella bronchialis]
MRILRHSWIHALTGLFLLGAATAAAAQGADTAAKPRAPDVIFVPTPQSVVDAMLQVAKVGPNDVLYDLGSGDGRIPITAAKRFGTRGVGVDIDPVRIQEARANAKKEGVTDKVQFIQGDLFQQDLSKATVISLYLLPSLNLKLRPTLLKLKPGTRIVSHAFDMGDWAPDQTLTVDGRMIYFWTVPGH